jgi:hypothetical protein
MERITKSPRTTFLGIIVLLVLAILVWFQKATLTEVSGFFAIGISLLFSKDKLFLQNFMPFMQGQGQQPDVFTTPIRDDQDLTHKN